MREKDGHDEGGRIAATMDEGEGRTAATMDEGEGRTR